MKRVISAAVSLCGMSKKLGKNIAVFSIIVVILFSAEA